VASNRAAKRSSPWPRPCIRKRSGARRRESHTLRELCGRTSELRETRVKDRAAARPLAAGVARLSVRAAIRTVLDDYRVNRRRSLVDVERHARLHLEPFFRRHRMATIATV